MFLMSSWHRVVLGHRKWDCFPYVNYSGVLAIPWAARLNSNRINVVLDTCLLFGPPKIVSSDNGTEFVNKLFAEFKMAFSHESSASYNPRAQGKFTRICSDNLVVVAGMQGDECLQFATESVDITYYRKLFYNCLSAMIRFLFLFSVLIDGFF